jgi:integrase
LVKPRVVRSLRVPHDFRHTAVRNLERAGAPRSTAKAMVGHRTESISRRDAIEPMLKDCAAKLECLINKPRKLIEDEMHAATC